ncbi:hypothetical protein ACK8OR_14650 [Jannaschia sp. KMU-145]|uniref:hypothetical protein n=1 Tax=Jannaschia halovivens TaxID=3388667 RepID=UPI00396B339C
MLGILAFVAGTLLLLGLLCDFLLTTIGAIARPILSGLVARRVFGGLRALHGALAPGRAADMVQAVAGTAVMAGVGLFWIVGFSAAWTLIYLSGGPAVTVEDASPDAAAGLVDIWAHVGHLLSTLGGATTAPTDTVWNAVGVLVGITGMVVLTLAVSFILATTQTVVRGRAMTRLVRLDQDVEPAALSDLVEALRASPFAAFYSHPEEVLGVPAALHRLAERGMAGGDGPLIRAMLSDLPEFEAPSTSAPDTAFLSSLSEWCARFMMEPPPR